MMRITINRMLFLWWEWGVIMYSIYLYSNNNFSRSSSQYGYWAGKSYTHLDGIFPICENSTYPRKEYKSSK